MVKRKVGTTYTDKNGYLRYVNSEGCDMDWMAAVNLMDREIYDYIRAVIPWEHTEHEFFQKYAELHKEKYGEVWELTKGNPTF